TPAAARQTAPASPAGCWQASCVPSHSSRLQGLPSSVHAVPAGSFASPGQVALEPVQCSAGSHSPAEARQTVVEGSKALAGQAVLVPVQVSSTSQSAAAARHTVPALPAGCWQALCVPSHSSRLQGLSSSVHAVPAGSFASPGQVALEPVQCSAGSHSPAEARQTVVEGSKALAGQAVLVPVQVSSTSQSPAAARHTVPALPAGCWQALCVPSHSSRLEGMPAAVDAVPAGSFASAGQVALDPVQCSAGSHSPAEARQTVVEGSKALAGQAVLVPVQVSSTSQTPAAERHTVPALPAGGRRAGSEPSHSSRLQGLPSSVHAVPAGSFASAGQVALDPVQCSAGSHSPAEARQTVVEGSKALAGQAVLVPVQVSSTSQTPAAERHTVPALPSRCSH